MSEDLDAEVVIIGSGPVGLSTALQLGRAGVRTLVLERRSGLTTHPKTLGVHASTMEIFRRWGLAEAVAEMSLPMERTLGMGWRTRLTGVELGRILLAEDAERMMEFASQCPEPPRFTPQDRVEPILYAAAADTPNVEIRRQASVEGIVQNEETVELTVTGTCGVPATVRARYVVGADGARSKTRELLGFGETGEPAYGESVNVYFRADLDDVTAGLPYSFWWILNRDIQGVFYMTSTNGTWIFNFEGDMSKPDDFFSPEYCVPRVRMAAGLPDLKVDVLRVLRWNHEQAIADRWRIGRVFLIGDAAHRFAPHGGFGMNSGIADSLNLAWKLTAVLRGWASEELLDTYEAERRPVAQSNATEVKLATDRLAEAGWLMDDPSILASIEEPEGVDIRARIAEAIPRQRDMLYTQGQQFGQIYVSSAIVDEGTIAPRSSVSTYVPTTHAGAHFPHMWLCNPEGGPLTTIDLLRDSFVLFAGPSGDQWTQAAKGVAAETGVTIDSYRFGGADADLTLQDPHDFTLLEIADDGAILVRPDGYVGFRSLTAAPDPSAALSAALHQILGLQSRQVAQ
jgi:putative polyketide hydroxylase